jgi:hypothetical protein
VTIFNAGDHANDKIGLMDEFTGEIDFLATKASARHLLHGIWVAVSAADESGVYYVEGAPKVFIPIRGRRGPNIERSSTSAGKLLDQMAAPDNRGDRFVYRREDQIGDEQAYHARVR